MAKGYSQGRSPNDRGDIRTESDGSTWDPGWVTRSDGTQAAQAERDYDSEIARVIKADAAARAGGGTGQSYDEITAESRAQDIVARQDALVSQRRSFSQERPEGSQGDPNLFGRVVEVHQAQTTQGVWTPERDKPEIWNVYVQVQPENDGLTPFPGLGYGHGDLQSLLLSLQWMVGGVTFSRRVAMKTMAVRRFQVTARKIMTDVTAINVGDATFGGQTFKVNLAVACGHSREVDESSPIWLPYGSRNVSTLLSTQVILPDPTVFPGTFAIGYLSSAVITAKALPAGGPFYPMFFNNNVAPVNGDFPLLVLPKLVSAGDVATADDEFVNAWDFDIGLTFGLSTTPDVFTNAGAGTQVRVDVKVGT